MKNDYEIFSKEVMNVESIASFHGFFMIILMLFYGINSNNKRRR